MSSKTDESLINVILKIVIVIQVIWVMMVFN